MLVMRKQSCPLIKGGLAGGLNVGDNVNLVNVPSGGQL